MRTLAVFLIAVAAFAQTPANVQFQCTDDDMQALGQSCSIQEPCPVYLDLAALDVVGPKLFVTGNIHSDTTTIASVLLASDDGGKTWTEPHGRIRSAGLDQIQFIDFEVGWISGSYLLGTPKDPFLLLTRDGGKSWRPAPVFEESHPGTVEQFWFDSRNSGTLLLDRVQASDTGARHELFESMTGGESWMLREASSSPIRMKRVRPAAPNPDWRLRADAATKSYRVEHRDAGKWSTMASFPVKVGECKPVENATVEPAPEAEKPDADEPKKEDLPKKPTVVKRKKR